MVRRLVVSAFIVSAAHVRFESKGSSSGSQPLPTSDSDGLVLQANRFQHFR
jgi:hypothetical protein